MNQTVIVGRIVKDPEVIEKDDGKRLSRITLAVSRPYKNEEGVYDTDFIDCTLWNSIADNTCEYCKKGDIIGIKGRLQSSVYEANDSRKYVLDVIAEKVTFLKTGGSNATS